jgi:hypothetical protein
MRKAARGSAASVTTDSTTKHSLDLRGIRAGQITPVHSGAAAEVLVVVVVVVLSRGGHVHNGLGLRTLGAQDASPSPQRLVDLVAAVRHLIQIQKDV